VRINLSKVRRFLASMLLVVMLVSTTACSSSTTATVPNATINRNQEKLKVKKLGEENQCLVVIDTSKK
jgi:hypothetical protein